MKNCEYCNTEFMAVKRVNRISRWCSRKCYLKDPNRKIKNYAINQRHGNWKGDDVKYRALHQWIEGKLGKPKKCEMCGLKERGKKYVWANTSGKYKRDLTDYMRMCCSCHAKHDMIKFGKIGRNQYVS